MVVWQHILRLLHENAGTLTAFSAILIVALLAAIAMHLRAIRRTNLTLASAGRRPFFVIESRDDSGTPVFALHNLGAGIALETTWSHDNPEFNRDRASIGAVAPGMRVPLFSGSHPVTWDAMVRFGGLWVTYTDATGKLYWTRIQCNDRSDFLNYVVNTGDDRNWISSTRPPPMPAQPTRPARLACPVCSPSSAPSPAWWSRCRSATGCATSFAHCRIASWPISA